MATMSQDLIFKFLGVDAGAGAEFDRMGMKSSRAGSMASKAMLGITVAASAVAVASVDMAAKFQTSMTRLHTQANVSNAAVAKFSAGVLDMAGSVATVPDVLAQAAYHIASVGQHSFTTAQELRIMKIAAEGAKLGGADLVDVTNTLDAVLVSNMKGVKNYSQVMGVLNSTVGAGDMVMQDLADALGPLGSTFKGFGVSIQQAGAALAVFGDNNVRGALAGSQLRMSITALADPLAAGHNQLIAWGDSAGNMAKQLHHGGLTEALDYLEKLMRKNGVTASEMGPKLAEMFGKRGPQQGLSMLLNQLDRYHGKLQEVSKGGSGFGSSWAAYTKTFGYALDSAKAAAESLMISLGTKLLPTATSLMKWLGGTAVPALSSFAHWLGENARWTKPLAIGLGLVGAALMIAFGGPVAIIAGITAITVGIIALYKHSETFRTIVQAVGRVVVAEWHAWRAVGVAVFHALSAVWHAFANGPLSYLQARFADFSAFWRSHSEEIRAVTHAVWHAISAVVRIQLKVMLDIARPALHALTAVFRVAWDIISGVVKTAWHLIAGVVATGTKVLLDTVGVFLDLITGHWGKAWDSLKQLASDAMNSINSILLNFGKDAVGLLYQAGKDIVSGLIHGITDSIGGVKNVLGDLGHKIISWKGPPEYDKVMLRPAGQMIIQGLIDGIKDKNGSVRVSVTAVGRILAQGLIGGWTGEAGRLKNLLGTDVENALNALTSRLQHALDKQKALLKTAQSTLHRDLTSRRSDTASLAGSIAGSADLSGAFTQDAAGNTVLGNVGTFAAGQVGPLKQFAADLAWASKHGLNKVDLAQIANMGAAQGDQILRQLMSGTTSVSALNDSQALIARYTRSAATTVEDRLYAHRIAADRRDVHEQTVTLHRMERHLREIERKAGRDIASHVTITVDKNGQLKLTDEDGREIVRELRKLASKGIKP